MWDKWVIDATMGWPPCLCPLEGDAENGDFSTVTGVNVIASKPPSGKIIGIVHAGGQNAVDDFCAKHENELKVFFEA